MYIIKYMCERVHTLALIEPICVCDGDDVVFILTLINSICHQRIIYDRVNTKESQSKIIAYKHNN